MGQQDDYRRVGVLPAIALAVKLSDAYPKDGLKVENGDDQRVEGVTAHEVEKRHAEDLIFVATVPATEPMVLVWTAHDRRPG